LQNALPSNEIRTQFIVQYFIRPTSHALISVQYSARSRPTRGVSRSEAWNDFFQWQIKAPQLAADRRERDLRPFGLNNLIGKLLERRVRLLGDLTCNCKML
jgi:hypothetical protein